MSVLRTLVAGVAAAVVLLVVNAALFPLVFPDGPPVAYADSRAQPLMMFHMVAFLVEGLLLACVYAAFWRHRRGAMSGAVYGAVVSLFGSLAHNLHMYAEVAVAPLVVLTPALWVMFTWALAGAVLGIIVGEPGAAGADDGEGDEAERDRPAADRPKGWYPGAAGRS